MDSGIGIAAGSQSSYSGSFSSYTGSLDTSSQGGSEEFGSVASLPTSSPPSAPPPSPPPSVQPTSEPDHRSSAATPCLWNSRSRHGDEHQTPSLLRLLGYDTPRRALQSPPMKHGPLQLCRDSRSGQDGGQSQRCSDRAPSVDGERKVTPRLLQQPGDSASEVGQNSSLIYVIAREFQSCVQRLNGVRRYLFIAIWTLLNSSNYFNEMRLSSFCKRAEKSSRKPSQGGLFSCSHLQ